MIADTNYFNRYSLYIIRFINLYNDNITIIKSNFFIDFKFNFYLNIYDFF
jgi:hypothetical protein